MKITNKQKQVVDCIRYENPKILICSGAKRAGKTWILIYAFIGHVAKYENKGYSFILGGTNQASLRRNVLNDLEDILGYEIKLSKDNHFKLFWVNPIFKSYNSIYLKVLNENKPLYNKGQFKSTYLSKEDVINIFNDLGI